MTTTPTRPLADVDEVPTTPVAVPSALPVVPPRLRQRRTPTPTAVLLIASFGAFLAFLDSTIVNIAFPDIQASFPDSSIGTLSWVLNAYNIVFAAFLVAAGRLADLLGRRRMFVIGVVLFTVASVLCAVAQSVGQLIGYRIVQGVGAAILVPASLALVVEGFDRSRRAHGVALWGAAAAIASGLGPPIGGALVNAASWRLAFLVNLPLGIVAVVVARRGLVESRSPGRRRLPDLRGAALLAATLGLLTLALVQGESWGWASLAVVGSFVGALAALGGFVASSRQHPAPLLDPALLRLRSFAVGNAATVVAGAGFYAYLLTHVLYLNKVWDYSLLRAGLAVAPGAFVAAAVASVLGKVADKHGHRLIVVPGALLWAGSLLWYLERVGTSPAFLTEWLPGQVISGIGVGATLPVLGSAALAGLPKEGGYATASAVVSSARQLGAVIGIAVLVILIGTPTPLNAVDHLRRGWMLAGCCFVVVAAISLLLGRTGALHVLDEEDAPPAPLATHVPDVAQPDFVVESTLPGDVLDGLPLLEGLSRARRARLRDLAEEVTVLAGQSLFEQGDPTDALYLVRTGRLQVVRDGHPVNELRRGAALGELGLLTESPRSATVRALRDSTLLRLSRESVDAVADLRFMTTLAQGLARRLQEVVPATPPARPGAVVIAVVGLDRYAPVDEVAEGLAQGLRTHLRVVTPGRIDSAGLEQAEQAGDRVLLAAGSGDRDWHAFCLRAADRIVLVSRAAEPPKKLPARARGADVVLPRTTSAEQRTQWEERVTPTSVHAVGESPRPAELTPLAARLAGRSLGLVLGGGGARAFAHLGVLEELERAGVAVDRFAGASVGAAVAGLAACGWDAAAVDACAYEYFVRKNPIGDYRLPTHGLIRGERTVSALREVFGELRVEALPHELRVTSVDLLARSRCVHRAGRVADVVASSLRLPGLYPPLPYDGSLHVDGGVLDNLPVSNLSSTEGPVIAVSISFGGAGGRSSREGSAPRSPRVPALGDTLMRTMMMASGQEAERAMRTAALVLRPDAVGVGLLEFHQIDRMRESGRAAARQALPQIEALLAVSPQG